MLAAAKAMHTEVKTEMIKDSQGNFSTTKLHKLSKKTNTSHMYRVYKICLLYVLRKFPLYVRATLIIL